MDPTDEFAARFPLARLRPPPFDPYEWKRSLDGLDGTEATDPWAYAEVGDTATFVYSDGLLAEEIEAEMVYANDLLTMWFADTVDYELEAVVEAADRFAEMFFPTIADLIGPVPAPGVDNDDRVVILHLDSLIDSAGEFSSYDLLPRESFPDSNEREMIYVAGDLEIGSDLHMGTIAHELTHLIDYSVQSNRPLWLAEGVAQLTEHALGLDSVLTHLRYMAKQPVQINDWGPLQLDDRHYGASFLLVLALWEQFGSEAIQDMLTSPYEGMGAVTDALLQRDVGLSDFFAEWMTTVALDHANNGAAGFSSLDNPRQCGVDHISTLPWSIESTVPQFAPRLVQLVGSGQITAHFEGSSTIGPITDGAYAGEWMWWAGPVGRIGRHIDQKRRPNRSPSSDAVVRALARHGVRRLNDNPRLVRRRIDLDRGCGRSEPIGRSGTRLRTQRLHRLERRRDCAIVDDRVR